MKVVRSQDALPAAAPGMGNLGSQRELTMVGPLACTWELPWSEKCGGYLVLNWFFFGIGGRVALDF